MGRTKRPKRGGPPSADGVAVVFTDDAHNTIVTVMCASDIHQFVCARGTLSQSARERTSALVREAGRTLFEEETWKIVERLRAAGVPI